MVPYFKAFSLSSCLLLLLTSALYLLARINAIPDQSCPDWLKHSGIANDLSALSAYVALESQVVDGSCGQYTPLHTAEGKYATRMRIYRAEETGATFIIFRYTVQPDGEAIHTNRSMTNCTFLSTDEGINCTGQVHDRFQEGFLSMIGTVEDWNPYLKDREVYVSGTSLGGAMQLFMGLYLWKVKGVNPAMSLGLAGPMIGDEDFAKAYQYDYRDILNGTWWQTETIDISNSTLFDDVVESYQVPPPPSPLHQLYVQRDVLCSFPIHPLPMPEQAFGMHDLRQYHQFLQGTDCSL